MRFRDLEITHIGVMRTWHDDPNDNGVGIYGKLSLDTYLPSNIWDWIDLADAVREAYGAPEEFAYVVCDTTGTWHILDNPQDLRE